MVDLNLGSVADRVLDRIPDLSAGVSGALVDIADEQRLFMENWTGATIGSTAIAEKYQPALVALTTASALHNEQLVGGDASTIKLAEFSVTKGSDSNVGAAMKSFHDDGMMKLRQLGRGVRYKQVL